MIWGKSSDLSGPQPLLHEVESGCPGRTLPRIKGPTHVSEGVLGSMTDKCLITWTGGFFTLPLWRPYPGLRRGPSPAGVSFPRPLLTFSPLASWLQSSCFLEKTRTMWEPARGRILSQGSDGPISDPGPYYPWSCVQGAEIICVPFKRDPFAHPPSSPYTPPPRLPSAAFQFFTTGGIILFNKFFPQ